MYRSRAKKERGVFCMICGVYFGGKCVRTCTALLDATFSGHRVVCTTTTDSSKALVQNPCSAQSVPCNTCPEFPSKQRLRETSPLQVLLCCVRHGLTFKAIRERIFTLNWAYLTCPGTLSSPNQGGGGDVDTGELLMRMGPRSTHST